ncbi:MAG: T9SS type A sorting domain-containing protein [Chitinophagales bacterium]|nr:T9SS type A sorting domain-containing protein [Chitinophagales bacterium]
MQKILQALLYVNFIAYSTFLFANSGYHINTPYQQELSDKTIMNLYSHHGPFAQFNPRHEAIEKRSETTKIFNNQDGTFSALITAGPIHYLEEGKWKTISNQIIKIQNEQYPFANIHNQIKTYYGNLNTGVSIMNPNKEMVLSYQARKMSLFSADKKKLKEINTYDNITPNISNENNNIIIYQLNEHTNYTIEQFSDKIESKYLIQNNIFSSYNTDGFIGFEEYITFKEDADIAEFINNKNTFKNKELVFTNRQGKQLLTYKDLFYYSGIQKHSSQEADYLVQKIDNKSFLVTMLVPLTWLNNKNTSYPITIDPTLSVVPNNTNSWTGCTGTLPNGTQPSGDNGYLGNNMECGFWDRDNSGNNDIVRDAFSKFNLSAIPSNICIINTQYKLFQYNWLNGNGNDGLQFNIGWANTDPVPDSRSTIYNAISNMERYYSYDVYNNIAPCTGCYGGADYNEGGNTWKTFDLNYPLAKNRILSRISNGFMVMAANVTYHVPNNSNNSESNIIYWRGYNTNEKPQLIVVYSTENTNPTASISSLDPTTCEGEGSITIEPTSFTPYIWYSSSCNDNTPLVGSQNIYGNAYYHGEGYLKLTENSSTYQQGTIVINNPENYNTTAINLEFSFYAQPPNSSGGDGWSITYAGDIPASPSGTPDGLSNANGLEILFREWTGSSSNCAHAVSVYYNNVQIGSCALHTNDWIGGTWRNVQLSINASNQLTLLVGNKVAFSNLQLPNDYVNIDKTGWKLALACKTGGAKENYSMDNITLWGYNQFEYSIDGGSNWQSSNTFNKPAGTYQLLMKSTQMSTCSISNLGSTTLSNPQSPTITNQVVNTTLCQDGTGQLNIGSNATQPEYQWQYLDGSEWKNTNTLNDITGSNTDILQFSLVNSSLNGSQFRCIVSENNCPTISDIATTTVQDRPSATPIVKNLFLCDMSAVLAATQINPENGTHLTWEKIAGTASATPLQNELFINNLEAGSTTSYQLKLTNGACQDIISGIVHINTPTIDDQILSNETECSSCSFDDGNIYKIVGNSSGHLIAEIEDLNTDQSKLSQTNICLNISPSVQNIITDEGDAQPYLQRSVAITPENNGKTKVRIYFTAQEVENLKTACLQTPYAFNSAHDLKVSKLPGVFPLPGQYNEAAVLMQATIVEFGNDYYAEFEVESFSTFYIHSSKYDNSPLPVELTSFTGIYNQDLNINELTWATASENNTEYFEVQRSIDGKLWNSIDKVAAHGFSNSPKLYHFKDENISLGINYYRLKIVDYDKSYEFSSIINIENKSNAYKNGIVRLFPNPTLSNLNIWISSNSKQSIQISILDIAGKNIQTWTEYMTKGINQLNINTLQLPSGTYILHYQDANLDKQSIKFIKE